MNRQKLVVFVALLMTTAAAEAGKIYGSLRVDGQAIAPGTRIVLNCSGTTYTTEVEKHGGYSVNVSQEGPCSISVDGYAGASAEVVSYNEATRYNFLLSPSGNGYSMERK
ncbi:MAG: hypothetical protein L0Z73_04315 [Gammaproteobacteria bacterium]|nr:hypothetical protein [Gammaproteobacteria bacterium]